MLVTKQFLQLLETNTVALHICRKDVTSFPGLFNCNPLVCHINVNGAGSRCFRLTPCTMPQQAAYWIISLERGKRAHSLEITTFNGSKSGKICSVLNICLGKCFIIVNSLPISWAGDLNSKIHTRPENNKWFFVASLGKANMRKVFFFKRKVFFSLLISFLFLQKILEDLSPLPESSLYLFQDTCTITGIGVHNKQGSFQTYTNKCLSFRSLSSAECEF